MDLFNIVSRERRKYKRKKQEQIANLDDYLLMEELKKLKSKKISKETPKTKGIKRNDLLSPHHPINNRYNDIKPKIYGNGNIPIYNLPKGENIFFTKDEDSDFTNDIENLIDLAERVHLINQNIRESSKNLEEYLQQIKSNIQLLSQKQTFNRVKKKHKNNSK